MATKSDVELVKSFSDEREYRHITLTNQLQCVLVSDPTTEKGSACCDVMVGSMCDPKEAQGLAHFLEHMLFMGTEKYPSENAYSEFLNDHGGYSNAYTSQENTVYYFDVFSDHFEHALDKFASFFTSPLFAASSTDREMNAVDSENAKNVQSDSWRNFQLLKSMARPDHPLSSFSTGNLQTLKTVPESVGTNTRDLMIDFYQKHYSANVMKLVVYSKQPLDQLEAWVLEKFSAVPNKNLSRPVFENNPFTAECLCKTLEVVPVKDLKTLSLHFPMPSTTHLYKAKPLKYLAHLFGHESDGSILAALKKKSWASGLSSYEYLTQSDFASYAISIELTDEGVHHVDEIVECVFAYAGMLQQSGPQDWVWQENKEIEEMNFRYLNKIDPADYTVKLSNNMHVYDVPHIISGDYLYYDKAMDVSMKLLNYISPSNMLAMVSHKGFSGKTTLKEQWYGTEYNEKRFSDEQLELWLNALNGAASQWRSDIKLPSVNVFIATDFGLKSSAAAVATEPTKYPALLSDKAVALPPIEETEAPVASAAVDDDTPKDAATEGQDGDDEDAEDDEEADDEEEEAADEEEDAASGAADEPVEGSLLKNWFLKDETWKMPKLNVRVLVESGIVSATPTNIALCDLFSKILKEILNEYSYYADCAGLYYNVELLTGGLDFTFQGFSHKLSLLIEKTLEEMKRLGKSYTKTDGVSNCPESLYNRLKEKLLRTYKNFKFSQPYYHCIAGSAACLEEPKWSNVEKYQALKLATYEDFLSFAAVFCRFLRVQVLVHGNATAEEAKDLEQKVLDTLNYSPLSTAQEPISRFAQLSAGAEYVYRQHASRNNPNEVNSAVENIYIVSNTTTSRTFRGGPVSPSDLWSNPIALEAMLHLLTNTMSEPAFDQLRTKEQLGYIVFTGVKKIARQLQGVQIIVQSSHKDPVYLDERVESFLTQFRGELAQFSTEKVQSLVQATVEKMTEKPKNLDEECSRYWEEIKANTYLFERKAECVKVLQQEGLVDLARLLEFYDRFLLSRDQRCKFSSQFYGKNCPYRKTSAAVEGRASATVIRDAAAFKRDAVWTTTHVLSQ